MDRQRRWRWRRTWYNIKCAVFGMYVTWVILLFILLFIWQMLPPLARRFLKFFIPFIILYKFLCYRIDKWEEYQKRQNALYPEDLE